MPLWARIALVLVLGTVVGFGPAIRDTVFVSFRSYASVSDAQGHPVPVPFWLLPSVALLGSGVLAFTLHRLQNGKTLR